MNRLPAIKRVGLQKIVACAQHLDDIEQSDKPAHRHPKVHMLICDLHEQGFTKPFPWKEWLAKQGSPGWESDHRHLDAADLETMRGLLTAHVRIERFSEGHLDTLFKSGYMRKAMSRLQELLDAGAGEP